MVRRMFLPFFSKKRGPPCIRMQVCGIRGKRFYKVVAANQRDPRDGKHMEVLGSYAPNTVSGYEEIRLRFSRIKFWLGVGALITPSMRSLLSISQLIPSPPPPFGRRTKGQYNLVQQMREQQTEKQKELLKSFYKNPDPIELLPEEPADEETSAEPNQQRKKRKNIKLRRILY